MNLLQKQRGCIHNERKKNTQPNRMHMKRTSRIGGRGRRRRKENILLEPNRPKNIMREIKRVWEKNVKHRRICDLNWNKISRRDAYAHGYAVVMGWRVWAMIPMWHMSVNLEKKKFDKNRFVSCVHLLEFRVFRCCLFGSFHWLCDLMPADWIRR